MGKFSDAFISRGAVIFNSGGEISPLVSWLPGFSCNLISRIKQKIQVFISIKGIVVAWHVTCVEIYWVGLVSSGESRMAMWG